MTEQNDIYNLVSEQANTINYLNLKLASKNAKDKQLNDALGNVARDLIKLGDHFDKGTIIDQNRFNRIFADYEKLCKTFCELRKIPNNVTK